MQREGVSAEKAQKVFNKGLVMVPVMSVLTIIAVASSGRNFHRKPGYAAALFWVLGTDCNLDYVLHQIELSAFLSFFSFSFFWQKVKGLQVACELTF